MMLHRPVRSQCYTCFLSTSFQYAANDTAVSVTSMVIQAVQPSYFAAAEERKQCEVTCLANSYCIE